MIKGIIIAVFLLSLISCGQGSKVSWGEPYKKCLQRDTRTYLKNVLGEITYVRKDECILWSFEQYIDRIENGAAETFIIFKDRG